MSDTSEKKIEKAFAKDFQEIIAIWESSVRATHHFLTEEDILFFKPLLLNEYLKAVDLYCTRDAQGNMEGFMGTSADKIEMLFLKPALRGKGIGKILVRYAIENLKIRKVDVNEQNQQAVGFYKNLGFHVVSRSALDSMGKPYPILSLALL